MDAQDEEVRNIDITGLYPELIEVIHPALRAHLEPMVVATEALKEVHVLAGITLRLVRLTLGAKELSQSGLAEECLASQRTALEGVINLLYIIRVGPDLEGSSCTELAEQFLAYGDVEYAKMLNARSVADYW